MGAAKLPAFPAPSVIMKRDMLPHHSGARRCEKAEVCLDVIASEAKQSRISMVSASWIPSSLCSSQ
jgi:hypothetical protein